jgi:IS30 family transposase
LRPKPCKLVTNPRLQRLVESQLLHNWSPQQIAGWLKVTYPEDEALWVSHETIYRTLYVQTRGALKKELTERLRTHRPIRRSRHSTAKADARGRIPDMVPISERPGSAEDRAVPGHWEGDLLCGSSNSYIITLVERHSRYVMLGKIDSRDTRTVVNALIKLAKKLPDHLYQSLTWDRGKELTDHKRFTVATDVQVYFCDPHSPWQRGSNENTNRLLRQYFPKGTDLSVHTQARLNYVARELNERPRETLGFETPKERFRACVASTSRGDWQQHTFSLRMSRRKRLQLGGRAVLIIESLHGEYRHVETIDQWLDVPGTEFRGQPDIVPGEENGIGIPVISCEALIQPSRPVATPDGGDRRQRAFFNEQVRRKGHHCTQSPQICAGTVQCDGRPRRCGRRLHTIRRPVHPAPPEARRAPPRACTRASGLRLRETIHRTRDASRR